MRTLVHTLIFTQLLILSGFGQSLNFYDISDLSNLKNKYLESEDFKKEFNDLAYLADKTFEEEPYTITKFAAPFVKDASINDYYSDSPYWWPVPGEPDLPYERKDGERNPDRFMEHKEELSKFYKGVLALAFCSYFTDETKYEKKINDLLEVWFINNSTKMNPNLKYSQLIRNRTKPRGVGIIDGRRLGIMTEAIILLKTQGKINDSIYAGVKEWYTEYLDWLTTSIYGIDEKERGNNHGTWWALQIAAISNLLQNNEKIDFINTHSKQFLLDNQIDSNAQQPLEEERTRSLSYSVFNLTAHTLLSATLSNYKIDNWNYVNKNGKTLVNVIDYLIPFIKNPQKWKIKQIHNFENSNPLFLGFAGLSLKNMEYLKLYNKLSTYDKKELNNPSFDPLQIILDSIVKMKLLEN